jgi:serine/threonine protein kinase
VQPSPSLTDSSRGEAAATADLSGRCVGNSYVLVCVLDTAGLTTPHAIVGTPHYMAPEAISGDAVTASDVYAVGVVLFELVTGHPPYAGEPLAVLRRHLDETPQHPTAMPLKCTLIAWRRTRPNAPPPPSSGTRCAA